ncbi:coiled-coil-helix-coiled-coil-helix domain-containing protein 7 [Fopius arisanus]|uniref:Coiled-coil-helix-coiled-coil-helix domain-containing protein 7 n=1 Tax=Fopius arisanus TaxID=64838 RepID=A0A9R1UAW2_9HYME|nr:PREDICTED: coiled-coil-helix-coiled-coil-helix domain-containing protein 7 [Fopius arisanus]
MAKNRSEIEAAKQQLILDNPCHEESEGSRRCLEKNNYNYDACTLYFDNFKACKKFWNEVKWSRKRQGITPPLPLPDDRKKIKAEYMEKMRR